MVLLKEFYPGPSLLSAFTNLYFPLCMCMGGCGCDVCVLMLVFFSMFENLF